MLPLLGFKSNSLIFLLLGNSLPDDDSACRLAMSNLSNLIHATFELFDVISLNINFPFSFNWTPLLLPVVLFITILLGLWCSLLLPFSTMVTVVRLSFGVSRFVLWFWIDVPFGWSIIGFDGLLRWLLRSPIGVDDEFSRTLSGNWGFREVTFAFVLLIEMGAVTVAPELLFELLNKIDFPCWIELFTF